VKHDVSGLPVADTLRVTEDAVEKPFAKVGLVGTVTRLRGFRQDIIDERAGVAGADVVVEESGAPVLLVVRVKVVAGKLTEIELVATRSRAEGLIFNIDGLTASSVVMNYAPRPGQLLTRDDAIKAALHYPQGLNTAKTFAAVNAPFAPDAYRYMTARSTRWKRSCGSCRWRNATAGGSKAEAQALIEPEDMNNRRARNAGAMADMRVDHDIGRTPHETVRAVQGFAPSSESRSAGRGEPRELKLHRVDLCQVVAGVVVAASLAASEPESAARVCVAGLAPAQVDDRREVLPLLQRGGGDAVAPEGAGDRAIQQRCGHFHRVSRHHPRVERVEPA
jgi:hypothetical protein